MNKRSFILIFFMISFVSCFADTIVSGLKRHPEWSIGAEISPSFVPQTNDFLKGDNDLNKKVNSTLGIDIRGCFRFNPASREGVLYKDLYQGIGIGANTFFANSLLGTPISTYVYQGAPIVHFNQNLWLGYEWQFGAAFGWKHYNSESPDNNAVVSTSVTAHMGLGIKLHYKITENFEMAFGLGGRHYSNGNTSYPNAGVNSLGAIVGFSYILNPNKSNDVENDIIEEEADKGRWIYDIMAFGSWRKRVVIVGNPAEPVLCPGKFGVVGFQFSPMRQLNRWIAVGPALDAQWDESGGLSDYWVDGSYNENIKFNRPPFCKQISIGLSAHAELIMPIFTVNAGLGYDIVNPKGDRHFYQSLTLKTFITKRVFLNVGYRLGRFKDPQNLMLGMGVRL